ncbi:MAG: hypothetical protein DWQ49_11720 [Bacteroidetes bacterium]|nr:MAG: hypothetical protein DWQ49_11720 [Bacteroidota bacterium]|tara:strand:- start:14 stop:316 length:303 start_codon:yes stop_codon:yes gene_type:complete
MNSFTGYADFFSDRFDRSVDAAGQQRDREDEASRRFRGQVQADLEQTSGGPTPPTMPDDGSRPQFDSEMDQQVDENVERTKSYLLEEAKKRINGVATPEV